MTSTPRTELPLVGHSAEHSAGHPNGHTGGGCCGGSGSCGCGGGEATTDASTHHTHQVAHHPADHQERAMTTTDSQSTQTFAVTGMTCGHCVHAVTDELQQLPGVNDVAVDLVAGGTSTVHVTSTEPLTDDAVASALDEAGDYHLA